MKKWILLFGLLLPSWSRAQTYSIDWYKMAGGGGASAGANSGGVYAISGTLGQQDAGRATTGGNYSLTGGFWSLIAAVPAAGVPNLAIRHVNPGSVVVSWPDTGSSTLQQNGNLATTNWTASGYSITTANGTNSITLAPPLGRVFPPGQPLKRVEQSTCPLKFGSLHQADAFLCKEKWY
jgi:hypothetical protein